MPPFSQIVAEITFLEGVIEVSREGNPLRIISHPTVFGELAILYNCMRTATVKGEFMPSINTVCVRGRQCAVLAGLWRRWSIVLQRNDVVLCFDVIFSCQSLLPLGNRPKIVPSHYDANWHPEAPTALGLSQKVALEPTPTRVKAWLNLLI